MDPKDIMLNISVVSRGLVLGKDVIINWSYKGISLGWCLDPVPGSCSVS